jgi:hypothetical protein
VGEGRVTLPEPALGSISARSLRSLISLQLPSRSVVTSGKPDRRSLTCGWARPQRKKLTAESEGLKGPKRAESGAPRAQRADKLAKQAC